jgi:hypothetical protein
MKRYSGHTEVVGGFYFSPEHWTITTVSGDKGMLEGTATDKYIKLPLPIMLGVAVGLSIGYVIFLPFIGFAMVGKAIFGKAAATGKEVARDTLATVVHPLVPGEAHFLGKEEQGKGEEKSGETMTALKDEIEKKRAEEESRK